MACTRTALLHGLRRAVKPPRLARTACTANLLLTSPRRLGRQSLQPLLGSPQSLSLATRRSYTYAAHPTQRNAAGALLSRVAGPTTPPLFEASLGDFWSGLVSQYSDNAAIVSAHEPPDAHADLTKEKQQGDEACLRWSFGEMDEHVQTLTRGMKRLGIRKGERVAVLAMNNSAMAALQLATALVGAPLVTLNPSYAPRELARALKHVGAKALFIVPSLRTTDYTAHLQSILPSLSQQAANQKGKEINDETLPLLKNIVLIDNITGRPNGWESESALARAGVSFGQARSQLNGWAWDYREVLQMGKQGKEEMDIVRAHDVVNLQLTSGTTGVSSRVNGHVCHLAYISHSLGTKSSCSELSQSHQQCPIHWYNIEPQARRSLGQRTSSLSLLVSQLRFISFPPSKLTIYSQRTNTRKSSRLVTRSWRPLLRRRLQRRPYAPLCLARKRQCTQRRTGTLCSAT